jgi:hypothetical protein
MGTGEGIDQYIWEAVQTVGQVGQVGQIVAVERVQGRPVEGGALTNLPCPAPTYSMALPLAARGV